MMILRHLPYFIQGISRTGHRNTIDEGYAGAAQKRGYERASLAVQKANYAVRMYEKVGFRTVDENDEEFIMVCEL